MTTQPKAYTVTAITRMIKTALAAKGIYYNADKAPHFFSVSDAAQQTQATRTLNWKYNSTYRGSDLYGAAYNLRLLDSSAAAWVHNGVYTRRILYDTLDYLDDGMGANNSFTLPANSDPDLVEYLTRP